MRKLIFAAGFLALAVSVAAQTPFQISNLPGVNYFGSVAFDGKNYLVVWQNYIPFANRIYAARVTPEGIILDPNGIFIGNGLIARVSAVAFDGLNYLVAWSTAQWEASAIYAARVGKDGWVLDPGGILVSPAEGQGLYNPAVAFNGTNYLVAWDRAGEPSGIFCARIATTGTVLDIPRITVSLTGGGYSDLAHPAVVSNSQDFLIVWRALDSGIRADIRGSRISASGVVLDPAGLAISSAPEDQISPTLSYDGVNYLAAWGDTRSGNNDIYAARVSTGGIVLDPAGIPIVTQAAGQYNPSIAFDGVKYLVAWPDLRSMVYNEVYGAHVSPQGVVAEPNGYQIYSTTLDTITSGLAFGFSNGLITWENYFSGSSSLYGKIIPLSQ